MIRTARTNSPSAHVKKRSKTMKGRTLGPGEFRIIPSEPGKAVRIVRFHTDDDTEEVFIECYSEADGSDCPANGHARLCSHAFKAISLLLKNNS